MLQYHFQRVPKTGVIYIMGEAAKKGYQQGCLNWVNLGQGQPEMIDQLSDKTAAPLFNAAHTCYGPPDGIPEFKHTVAQFYNHKFRQNQNSLYQEENVVISPGGRAGLSRVLSSLGNINLGHFLPDYTAYEELLGTFKNFGSIPIALSPEKQYRFSPQDLYNEMIGKGLGAVLLSNPSNPTGKLVHGDELKQWVEICTELNCALILDEFYSKYIWVDDGKTGQVSAARYIDDVNKTPVIIIDGVTKNWHYPGLRISWTLGPAQWMKSVMSTASFLDGGPGHPNQVIANALLKQDNEQTDNDTRKHYAQKRAFLIERAQQLGLGIDLIPEGTFYLWYNVSRLPETINTGMKFFTRALEQQLIVVPGDFFDINPGQRRFGRGRRFGNYIRLSFAPGQSEIERGLEKMAQMIAEESTR